MLDDEDICALAQAGGSAPTGGNSQPWRLRATADSLEVSLDEARSGAFIDVDCASSLLGIGAFVENVAVAARSRGLEPTVETIGLGAPDDSLVRISFERVGPSDDAAIVALRTRTTNRRPWNGEVIPEETIARVAEAAEADGQHRLVAVSGDAKSAVADALAEADVIRTFNQTYREEMHSEFRWSAEEANITRDGIDLATLELAAGDRKGLGMMRRRWFVSLFVTRKRIREMGRRALLDSSHLAAVVMPRAAERKQLVAAGRAVERMWLAATRAGLAIQPWCVLPFFRLRAERHPESLPTSDLLAIGEIADQLRGAWNVGSDERVIFTFRLSIPAGPPSALALRRPWTDFTTIEREDA